MSERWLAAYYKGDDAMLTNSVAVGRSGEPLGGMLRCESLNDAKDLTDQINRGALLMDLTPEQIKSINWAKVPGLVSICRKLAGGHWVLKEALAEVEGR